MTLETIINENWKIILVVAALLILFCIALMAFRRKKEDLKELKPSREVERVVQEVRKEIREEHKRLTTLFRDLDLFILQLSKLSGVRE